MPFPRHIVFVTGGFQNLCYGQAVFIQVSPVAVISPVVHHVPDTGQVLVQSGKQGSPRGTTPGSVVKLRVPKSVGRQLIQVRCPDLSTVTAYIRKTHIIGHDQDDVRPDLPLLQ